jgi:hypothetical protein
MAGGFRWSDAPAIPAMFRPESDKPPPGRLVRTGGKTHHTSTTGGTYVTIWRGLSYLSLPGIPALTGGATFYRPYGSVLGRCPYARRQVVPEAESMISMPFLANSSRMASARV